LRFLRLKIGQRWPESEMDECDSYYTTDPKVSVHRFSVPRSGLVFCLELAPMPENKGYRSEIRGFSSDFMDVRGKKSLALKFKPKVLIYAL